MVDLPAWFHDAQRRWEQSQSAGPATAEPRANGVHKPEPAPEISPREAADDPHRLARLHVDATRSEGQPTLRYWREEYRRWDGRSYQPVPDKEAKADLCRTVK